MYVNYNQNCSETEIERTTFCAGSLERGGPLDVQGEISTTTKSESSHMDMDVQASSIGLNKRSGNFLIVNETIYYVFLQI